MDVRVWFRSRKSTLPLPPISAASSSQSQASYNPPRPPRLPFPYIWWENLTRSPMWSWNTLDQKPLKSLIPLPSMKYVFPFQSKIAKGHILCARWNYAGTRGQGELCFSRLFILWEIAYRSCFIVKMAARSPFCLHSILPLKCIGSRWNPVMFKPKDPLYPLRYHLSGLIQGIASYLKTTKGCRGSVFQRSPIIIVVGWIHIFVKLLCNFVQMWMGVSLGPNSFAAQSATENFNRQEDNWKITTSDRTCPELLKPCLLSSLTQLLASTTNTNIFKCLRSELDTSWVLTDCFILPTG